MLRFYAQYSSSQKTAYQINIYDRDFSGDPVRIYTVNTNLRHNGDPDNPFKRISGAKLEFSLPLRLNEYNETVLDELVDFYSELSESPEGRFYVTFRQLLVSGSILLFKGKIIIDLNELTLNYHKDLKITAIDGIEDLKSIEYRPSEYSDTSPLYTLKVYSWVQHFIALLKKSETNVFFYEDTSLNGTGDVMLYTSPHWIEDFSAESGEDIWAITGIRNMFYEQRTPSYRKYTNCYDVLTQMLEGFNARLIYSKGIYIIEQLSILDNLTVMRHHYKYNGDVGAGDAPDKLTHNIESDNNSVILSYPSINNIPGLKAVELVQNSKIQNFLAGFEVQWPATPGPHNFGYVLSEGQQMGIAFSFDVKTNVNPYALDPFHLLMIEMEIKIDDYYLKSLANPTNPVSSGYDFVNKGTSGALIQIASFEWTLDASTIKIVYNTGPSKFPDLNEIKSWIFYGGSLEIPVEGDLIVTMLDPKILNIDLTENATETAKLESVKLLNNSRMIISPAGYGNLSEPPDKISLYEIGNSKNTLVYKMEFPFFDVPYYDALLQLNNAERGIYYLDPVAVTTEWTDPDSLESYEIQKLAMRSILSMRKTPTKVRSIKLHIKNKNVVTADNRFVLNGEVFIPVKFEHDTDEDVYTIWLWLVYKDYAGINIEETDDPTIPTPLPPSIITESAGIGGRLNIYAAKTITSTETVNLDGFTDFGEGFIFRIVNYYTFADLYKRWFVTVGGVEQDLIEPDDPLPALGPGEFTLDEDTNELVFWYMDDDSKVVMKFFD